MGKSSRATATGPLGVVNTTVAFVAAILGAGASWALLKAELDHLANPAATPSCDLNSLIGCGASLNSPQAHLLGIPNSALGLVGFTVLAILLVLAFTGAAFGRVVWPLLGLGALGGLALVVWFLYHSVVTFGALCPFCLLIWSATLTLACILIPAALVALSDSDRSGAATILSISWATIIGSHLVVALVIIITMRSQIGALL